MDFVNTIMQGVCVHLIGSHTVGAPVRFSSVVVMRSHVRLSRVDHSCSHTNVQCFLMCVEAINRDRIISELLPIQFFACES